MGLLSPADSAVDRGGGVWAGFCRANRYRADTCPCQALSKCSDQRRYFAVLEAFCEDYDDGYHRNKAELLASAERAIKGASVKKVRFQRIELNRQERRAKMDMDTVVHLNADSRYAGFGSVVFVSLRLEFAKRPSGPWCIRRAGVISINNQPIKWGAVR